MQKYCKALKNRSLFTSWMKVTAELYSVLTVLLKGFFVKHNYSLM